LKFTGSALYALIIATGLEEKRSMAFRLIIGAIGLTIPASGNNICPNGKNS
jgi:hypothetical protein